MTAGGESGFGWLSSIRGRLFIGLALCGVVPVAVIALTNLTFISSSIKDSEYQKFGQITNEVGRQVSSIMDSAESDLRMLETNRVMTNPKASLEELEGEMKRIVDIYHLFSDITLYHSGDNKTTNRNMIVTTIPPEAAGHPLGIDYSRGGEDASLKGERTISNPGLEFGGGRELFVTAYLPIEIAGTTRRKVAMAQFPFLPVWNLLDGVDLGGAGQMVLLDSNGNVLAHRDKNRILTKFEEYTDVSHWKSNPKGVFVDSDQNEYAYVAKQLSKDDVHGEEPWTLIALVPLSEISSIVRESSIYQMVAASGTLILALLGGILLSSKIARSVVGASEAADEVARGKMGARIPDEGPREIRSLASAFNKMVEEVSCHREELESLVDIRTRKLRESQGKLEETSAQLRAAFESTREAILIVRHDGVVITANRRIKEYFGLSNQEMTWAKFDDFREPLFDCFTDRAGFKEAWDGAESNPDFTCDGEWEIVGPEPRVVFGYTVPVRNQSGEAFAHLWTFEDITRERELQRGLEQAQKMEAVGRLAGGVAHDFNNLLTGIIGNLSLVEMAAGGALAKSGASKYIVTAKQAGERAADLVKQLLGFSRKSHLTLEHCDVNGIVAEVRNLLSHTLDPRISIESDIESGLWGVKVDPTQVQQVVMNMCVNAKDALGASGIIRLRTENVHVDQVEASQHDAQSGDYVKLCVADDGQGIPPEILDKVFEPFFTTKEPGKGTGLGLATCYGIVQQHGGWIECDSEVGSGTTFSIYLPRKEQENLEEKSVVAPVEQPSVGGSEAILLVDDDIVVRGVAECVLKHHGYEVVCASDGREAVESVRERGEDFSLVLLDLTMPNVSGKDAFKMIKDMYPEMKVLFCSGYMLTYEEFEKDGGYRPEGFVQKPYDIGTLAASVRSTIDDDAPVAVKESVEA